MLRVLDVSATTLRHTRRAKVQLEIGMGGNIAIDPGLHTKEITCHMTSACAPLKWRPFIPAIHDAHDRNALRSITDP